MKYLIVALLALMYLSSCGPASIEAGNEGVMVMKPWFFGHGGVSHESISTGLIWKVWTTDVYEYNLKPVQSDEQFDNIVTLDNNPVDFHAYIELQLMEGKAWELHERWGSAFYANKIQEKFRFEIRNQCRHYTMFDLTTNGDVVVMIAGKVLFIMKEYVKEQDMPLLINRVTIGKVYPPKEVIDETIKTAAQVQRVKTETSRATAELSRYQAEVNKAKADRAYALQFGMTNNEYLKLRQLEIQKEMLEIVKGKENVNTILNFGENQSMFNAMKQ
jgi:regulator of protease activity HflC (stomatin/prohibitin superfamily)